MGSGRECKIKTAGRHDVNTYDLNKALKLSKPRGTPQSDPSWQTGYANQPLGSSGTYWVTVVDLGSSRRRLTASGTSNLLSTPISRTVEAIVRVAPSPLFDFAMFGDERLKLTGNAFTDSYDSRLGLYNPATAGAAGDVSTNSISASHLELTGNARVHGDAFVGTGGDPSVVINTTGNSNITGGRFPLPTPQPMTPVTIPGGLTNSGNLNIAGNTTVTLPGGTYWYEGIGLSGNGRLNFTGPATVYISGTLSVSGNGIGTAQNLPTNLLIYSQGISSGLPGGGDVTFSGNAAFYGAIYAPQSKTRVTGNGALYGAIAGKEAESTGNGGIHFDVALRDVTASGGGIRVEMLSWQDLSGS